MSQKRSPYASSLQQFSQPNLLSEEARFDLDINSKLPAELRKALDLDAEDKEWKNVDKIEDLKESKQQLHESVRAARARLVAATKK